MGGFKPTLLLFKEFIIILKEPKNKEIELICSTLLAVA